MLQVGKDKYESYILKNKHKTGGKDEHSSTGKLKGDNSQPTCHYSNPVPRPLTCNSPHNENSFLGTTNKEQFRVV
jgi:hypothetical protein